jgi:DNA polymerase-3 subunit epsilon
MNKQERVRTFNSYVDVDDDVEISPKITEITGIVRETCKSRGIPIQDVLTEFYRAYQSCDVIIAHNIDFDKEMIMVEVIRNYSKMLDNGCENPSILFNEIHNIVYSRRMYCTMLNGKDFCDIWVEGKFESRPEIKADGTTVVRKYKKNPKLSELYFKIFNEIPLGLHDALVDTETCLKCYIYLISTTKN